MSRLVIPRQSPLYPRALEQLSQPPPLLWLRGSPRALRADASRVAIVGARGATMRAVARARQIACELADEHVIVSGGALGVDGAAHLGALDARGETLVVLGSGIDVLYPARHRRLFERVVDSGAGALLSIFEPGTEPRRWTFPARNPVIAALAGCVLVVEAGARSGSLQTARIARKLGRGLGALAGSAGTARLLADGAARVDSVADVRALLAGDGSRRGPSAILEPRQRGESSDDSLEREARTLLEVLLAADAPCRVVALAHVAGLSPTRAASVLVRLELAGRVEALPGARYRAL